jgi:hypothetical protein
MIIVVDDGHRSSRDQQEADVQIDVSAAVGTEEVPAQEPATHWVFVAHPQVGLLHRLRPVARASTSVVLVRLDPGAHPRPDVQVGVAHSCRAPLLGQVRWLAGLSAPDVSSLLAWLAAEPGPADDLPADVSRRWVTAPGLVT